MINQLKEMDFPPQFTQWINSLMSSPCYSIVINGSRKGFVVLQSLEKFEVRESSGEKFLSDHTTPREVRKYQLYCDKHTNLC